MDPSAVQGAVAAPTGIAGWVAVNGTVAYFLGQMAFWFFMVLLVGYAVFQYKRWVNYQLGIGRSGQLRNAERFEADVADEDAVSIDEFVE